MLKTLLVFLLILFAGVLSAKTLTKMNFPMNGNAFVINGNTNPVTHYAQLPSWENWVAFHNSPQKFYSFTNTIELDQLESIILPVDFSYTLQVKGVLKYKVFGSSAQVMNNITLKISSDTSQKTSRTLDYYSYSNAYESEFDIQTVTLTTTQTGLTQSQLYDTVSKAVELNFGIQGTKFLKPVYNTIPALQNPCVDNATDELIVSWTPVDFAEEYELEITFKDNYTNDINTALPLSAITYDFKENSTRIVTKQNYYRIPLVYERGYLLFRVRVVGMGGAEWDKRIPCAWSGPSSGNAGAFVNKYGPIAPHVSDQMNWQLSTTYTDEGKRKDSVQYYDGLNMIRQTVTGVSQVKNMFTQNVQDNSTFSENALNHMEIEQTQAKNTGDNGQNKMLQISSVNTGLNSIPGTVVQPFPSGCTFYGSDKIKEIIAQEVIYDFNGRPALQILPAPTGTHKLTYIKNLNKNSTGDPYSWKDFDILNNCLLTAHPLSDNVSGNALEAGAYYSPKNPNKLGYNAFIPDSKGYPFSRIQYTYDNTGRTYRQAGVGPVFTMDIVPEMPGHETKFYYAKPNQPELDRMFGNEVGYAIRYQKNMVVDPNGQVSVTYLNPEGKTIATSLAGVRPDNLLNLDHENYPSDSISVDLMASNIIDSLEHSLTINEQFVVPQKTDYSFTYNVNGAALNYSSCANNNICLDCIYDLNISLISNDGCDTIPLFSYSGTFGDLAKTTGQVHTDLLCFDGGESQQLYAAKPGNFPTSFVKTLDAGSYTLIKILKVNQSAADAYVNLVFKDTCQSVLQQFLTQEEAKIDTLGCNQSCSACKDSNIYNPSNCDTLCSEPMNACDQARHMMLLDVSPGGQYAQYDITPIGYDASSYPLSIFNLNNVLPNHPNWQSISGTTDLQSLILNWDKNASPIPFLSYHPEYCMLQWCDNVNTGKDYDLELAETTTFAGAVSADLLNTTSSDPAYKQLLMNDPFFHNSGGALTNTGNTFLNFLANPCGNNESVLIMDMDAAYCQSQPGYQNITSNILASTQINAALTNPQNPQCTLPPGYNSSHIFGQDPATKDLEWWNLRDLYRTFKEKYLYESRRDYSISNGCFNGCIGAQNYFFSPTPLSGHNGRSYSVEGTIPVNSSDLCGITEGLYNGKVKRFTNRYDAFSHMDVDLRGINLYNCLTPDQIADIQSQIGGIVDQYLCDTCITQSSTGNPDTCWVTDFSDLLNQYLPSVTSTNTITLNPSQIPSSIKNMWYVTSSNHLVQINLIYIASLGSYNIFFTGENNDTCTIYFPAKKVNNIPKPLRGVCCVNTINETQLGLTLNFSDGTSSNVVASALCTLPLCKQSGTGMPCDTCSSLNPFTSGLFSFMNSLKQPGFPQIGKYVPQGNEDQLQYLLSSTAPLQYAMNQSNCSLTFWVANGKSCTIRFSDCNWLNSNTGLISIKPYLSPGQINFSTNEFILTYVKPHYIMLNNITLDTITVGGTNNCFSINECHKPYFCGIDSMLKPLPPNNFNGCVQAQLLTAIFNAYSLYGKWQDSMKNDLRQKYYARCLQAGEDIRYTYLDNQFHYTLYYYDQAGNLVRTVPPAGVRLLPLSDTSAIDNKRNNTGLPGGPILPNHIYITNYAYNSLNQERWQTTPDAGRTDFWYDKLGRIASSQNAKQLPKHDYSYSWYDKLGRKVESGNIHLSGSLNFNAVSDYNYWQTYLYSIPDRTEIIYTKYDEPFLTAISNKFGPDGQQNLRSRVASILSFTNNTAQSVGKYRHATNYSYDVIGNVPIVIQSYPGTPLGDKVIAYNFDLLTGKVNEMRYEPGLQDEFRHKYSYDDELRLVNVQTSTKGIIWETEAEYSYYKHGPLARTELGQLKVQGLDYIYTLQGWIKAVNGTTQDRSQDAGRDGIALHNPKKIATQINGQPVITFVETEPNYNSTGSGYHSLHNTVAADAFGYVLGYYNDPNYPDYTPIDPAVSTTTGMDATTIGDTQPLYNGNISRMYTWLQTVNGLGMNYRYDRLNRLKLQQAFTLTYGGGQSLLEGDAYGMELSYDGSGNIITLKRNGRPGNTAMDDLKYHYYDAGNNEISDIDNPPANATNKLASVSDAVSSGNYPESHPVNETVTDIDNQNPKNYNYDAIGNLISDNSEHINQILWNLQNKITGIAKTDGTEIDFAYDALGNRVYKKFAAEGSTHHPPYTSETYYVRDAKGNVLATYEIKNSSSLRWQEANIYGVNRLGVWHPGIVIAGPTHGLTGTIDWQNITVLTAPVNEDSTIRGSKQYELSNHLGNVLATISDRKMQTSNIPANGTSGITADLITAADYYAFGMQMPGRNFYSDDYRFGFNGKLNDNEVYGEGNFQDYGFRMYDTRVCRFISVDPLTKKYPELTPYQFASNTPIKSIDLDGLEQNPSTGTETSNLHIYPLIQEAIAQKIVPEYHEKNDISQYRIIPVTTLKTDVITKTKLPPPPTLGRSTTEQTFFKNEERSPEVQEANYEYWQGIYNYQHQGEVVPKAEEEEKTIFRVNNPKPDPKTTTPMSGGSGYYPNMPRWVEKTYSGYKTNEWNTEAEGGGD